MLKVQELALSLSNGTEGRADPPAPRAIEETPSASGPMLLDRMRQALRSRHWAKPGRPVPNRCAVHTLRDLSRDVAAKKVL